MSIKVLAAETNLGSATNVGSATVVKLLNNQGSADQVIRKDSGGATIGSFTMAGNESAFVEKDPTASGYKLVNLGFYKFYKKDITLPMRLPISIEYDILPNMELEYKVLNTVRFDIGTPERLERFKTWLPT